MRLTKHAALLVCMTLSTASCRQIVDVDAHKAGGIAETGAAGSSGGGNAGTAGSQGGSGGGTGATNTGATAGTAGMGGTSGTSGTAGSGGTAGLGGSGGSGGIAPTCLSFPGSPGCSSCMTQHCCPEVEACGDEQSCLATFECMANCPDEFCESTCFNTSTPFFFDALGCRAVNCSSECELSCGGVIGPGSAVLAHLSSQECIDCVKGNACPAITECAQSSECIAYYYCYSLCGPFDIGCGDQCAQTYPEANSLFFETAVIASQECATTCPVGDEFSCLGSVVWPAKAESNDIVLTVVNKEYSTQTVVPDATVRACSQFSSPCEQLGVSGVTNEVGEAVVSIPGVTGVNGVFKGYLLVHRDMPLENGGILLDTLFYPGIYPAQSQHGGVFQVLPSTVQQIAQAIQGPAYDPSLGAIGITTQDCFVNRAPNITVTLKPSSGTGVYLTANPADWKTATSTDSTGQFSVYNVAPGQVTIEAWTTINGVSTVFARRLIVVNPGALTMCNLPPTPGLP